jgi:hypothetical protein
MPRTIGGMPRRWAVTTTIMTIANVTSTWMISWRIMTRGRVEMTRTTRILMPRTIGGMPRRWAVTTTIMIMTTWVIRQKRIATRKTVTMTTTTKRR